MNLYDVTRGNYRVSRTVSFPDFPDSKLVLDVTVVAKDETNWETEIEINGVYDGPTEIVAQRDYRLIWTSDGQSVMETGSAQLESASGEAVAMTWSSTITPDGGFEKFPEAGEVIDVEISPFQVAGNSMSYEWEGKVGKRPAEY